MWTSIFLGAAISGIVGFVLSVPAILLESSRRVKNLPVLIDVKFLWKVKLTEGEVFVVSLLFHLIISTLVGGCYVWFAEHGWLFITHNAYSLLSVILFTIGTWLVTGFLLYPLIGMGFFGRREGKHLWIEMLLTHLLIGLGFWIGVAAYRPFFF